MKLDVLTLDAELFGSIELSDKIFSLKPRKDIIHRMINYQLVRRQSGTHKTKSRSEVIGSTRKFVRQKGSGGARHGNKKPSIFRGGAKAFGPIIHSRTHCLPKKIRALALKHALSTKAMSNELIILDNIIVKSNKTKDVKNKLLKLKLSNALFIDGVKVNEKFALAARNIMNIDILPIQGINVYDILRRKKLILTKAAVKILEIRFNGKK